VPPTLANIRTVLNGLIYRDNGNFNGSDTTTAYAVNHAPFFTGPGAQLVNEDATLIIDGISVSDADSTASQITLRGKRHYQSEQHF